MVLSSKSPHFQQGLLWRYCYAQLLLRSFRGIPCLSWTVHRLMIHTFNESAGVGSVFFYLLNPTNLRRLLFCKNSRAQAAKGGGLSTYLVLPTRSPKYCLPPGCAVSVNSKLSPSSLFSRSNNCSSSGLPLRCSANSMKAGSIVYNHINTE